MHRDRGLQFTGELLEILARIHPGSHDYCRLLIDNYLQIDGVFDNSPSLFERRELTDRLQSPETLTRHLCSEPIYSLLLPTKVSVGRSMFTAKFNIYGFIYRLCRIHEELASFRETALEAWENALFTLLLEDLYLLILDRRKIYTEQIRMQTAEELMRLWEDRDERQSTRLATEIIRLWRGRKHLAPVFGTMLGTLELMSISSRLSQTWNDFLRENNTSSEFVRALEEFLFGLSAEQITYVRTAMEQRTVHAVTRGELYGYLDEKPVLDPAAEEDPRALYLFFQRRSELAAARVTRDLPGPRRTIEEQLLVYLLERGRKK